MVRHRTLLAVSTSAVALAALPAAGLADIISGTPTQQSSVSNTNSQIGQQVQGGGVVVGDQTQSAANTSSGTSPSSQTIGGGSSPMLVGGASQKNSQGNVAIQSLTQNTNGGTNSGTTFSLGLNAASNTASNAQTIDGAAGETIIGDPTQENSQYGGASQGIEQDPLILLAGGCPAGEVCQGANNENAGMLVNAQTIGGGGTVVGNPGQANSQVANVPQFITQSFLASPNTSNVTQELVNENAATSTSTQLIL
jgi:hypothetical protein